MKNLNLSENYYKRANAYITFALFSLPSFHQPLRSMRLVKQSFLYFKEGNSDKVYEIDLADVGNDRFVVNFRYGRRGSVLKEGSKTPIPLSCTDAETIYETLLNEKLGKGYTTAENGVSPITTSQPFVLDTANAGPLVAWETLPSGRAKSILRRLNQAVQGTEIPRWKLSRVIWKAGEYKIREATPYLIRLFNKDGFLHQYSCTWALVRCGGETAVVVLQSIYANYPSTVITKIARAGLLQLSTEPERQEMIAHLTNSLPEAFLGPVRDQRIKELATLLEERIEQKQVQYNWLETLYLLAFGQQELRPLVKKTLLAVPLRPGYFRHIRAIYKLAELLDDLEITGLLACQLERSPEFFRHYVPSNDLEWEIDVEELDEPVNPHQELKRRTVSWPIPRERGGIFIAGSIAGCAYMAKRVIPITSDSRPRSWFLTMANSITSKPFLTVNMDGSDGIVLKTPGTFSCIK
jgi:hypothetical protein